MTVGRIVVTDRDRGAGFALAPGWVVTAGHVVRDVEPAGIRFVPRNGEAIDVVEMDHDEKLDIAVLRLAAPVPATLRPGRATQGARWQTEPRPSGHDPLLTGVIAAVDHHITNSAGHDVSVLQLTAQEQLGSYVGYSGAPVTLTSPRNVVVGVLTEQVSTRAASNATGVRPASNVLYAVPVQAVLDRFELTEHRVDPPPLPHEPGTEPLRDQIDWLSDSPARLDLLKRKPLAHALAVRLRRLRRDEPANSFLIHLDGPWGSGKSTVLNLLHDELADDWLVITFDAWRQSTVGPAWWALLAAMRHDFGQTLRRFGRLRLRTAETWHRARRSGAPYLLALSLLALVTMALFFLLRPQQLDSKMLGDTLKAIAAAVSALGLLWAGTLVASRFLLWDSARGARLFEQSNANPMQEVTDHFAWLVRRAGKPVVFFIDDLDRCNEKYVVELLDTIQTMLRQNTTGKGTYFVVAGDGAWIRNSYEVTYESFTTAVAEPGRPLGYLFLDKLFQLSVSIPALSRHSQSLYLGALLRTTTDEKNATKTEADLVREKVRASGNEAEVVEVLRNASPAVRHLVSDTAVDKLNAPLVQKSTEHALARFAPLLDPNPRSMKRFLNAYTMTRNVRTLEGSPVEIEPLALWTILQIRWPSLADYLRRHPDGIDWVGKGDQYTDRIPEPLLPLFDAPELTRLARYGTLTPAQIRACCGNFDPEKD